MMGYGYFGDDRPMSGRVWLLLIVWFLAITCRGSFCDPQVAVHALDAQGYTEIHVTDHSYFLIGFRGCDNSDAARFTVDAKNPAGKQTQVYVCTGLWFKGATIRTQ